MESNENRPNLENNANSTNEAIDNEEPLKPELTEIGEKFVKGMLNQLPAEITKVRKKMEEQEADGEDIDEIYHGNTAEDEAFEMAFNRIWKEELPITTDWERIHTDVADQVQKDKARHKPYTAEAAADLEKEFANKLSRRHDLIEKSRPRWSPRGNLLFLPGEYGFGLSDFERFTLEPLIQKQQFEAYSKLLPETYQSWMDETGFHPDEPGKYEVERQKEREPFLKYIEGDVKRSIQQYVDNRLPENLKSES